MWAPQSAGYGRPYTQIIVRLAFAPKFKLLHYLPNNIMAVDMPGLSPTSSFVSDDLNTHNVDRTPISFHFIDFLSRKDPKVRGNHKSSQFELLQTFAGIVGYIISIFTLFQKILKFKCEVLRNHKNYHFPAVCLAVFSQWCSLFEKI